MSEPFLAEIKLFSFGFSPRGWANCAGQLLPINQNQALFSLLGTTYGGNGTTNFALPDFRGRAPLHWGGGVTLGERGGQETVSLTAAQMPSHAHPVSASSLPPSVGAPTGSTWASGGSAAYAASANASMAADTLSPSGGSQPHSNLQPHLALNFCIALQGIFPSRS